MPSIVLQKSIGASAAPVGAVFAGWCSQGRKRQPLSAGGIASLGKDPTCSTPSMEFGFPSTARDPGKTWRPQPPLSLRTATDHLLRSDQWTVVAVEPLEGGLVPSGGSCKYLAVGDTKHAPQELEACPAILTNDPAQRLLVARCINPPFYLAKGQVLAQAISIPSGIPVDSKSPDVYWAEVVGENKPIIYCNVQQGNDTICLEGLLDTGADVMIIPWGQWPSHWELQPMAGRIQGIGGTKLAKISKSIVQTEGPDGKLATLSPFVMDYQAPLWGRDAMSQWRMRLEILKTPQDF
ncbi:uncharacterized protein LOC109144841 [Corvus cornix cornix]|uniref:uncharacterized protein LOC109144841 n=1 Tax=Corvus cornix cornix TaxID=932674 RepID=UPI0009AE33C2|nr:uncharacterized protein LOC109144841 [Corvus cornix cornix]